MKNLVCACARRAMMQVVEVRRLENERSMTKRNYNVAQRTCLEEALSIDLTSLGVATRSGRCIRKGGENGGMTEVGIAATKA
ncbi:hypothetical protein PIB30_013494 [Stylosanthes scabra]|uniref:Uncharacterized protein n=1 Tax=Stylosanthes scabra TaxID=79078 RepID=A0ABU6Q6A5_9FABA|nr:hypothetical protein [Stylosanthes scabra]